MAVEPAAAGTGGAADACRGLELPGLGCLSTGEPGFDAILALVPVLFGFWMKLLGGETWRIRIGALLYDASWSSAYAGLLEKLLGGLQRFFGGPWSARALHMCFRLAVLYALAYLLFGAILGSGLSVTTRWIFVGLSLLLGLVSFFVARAIRRRHVSARRQARVRKRRAWLQLREQLAYSALAGASWAASLLVTVATDSVVGAGAAVFIFIGAIAGAGVIAAAAALVIIGAVAGVLAGAAATVVGIGPLIIPPILNALFDWPSWAVSRWLMGRLRADAALPGFFRRAGALLVHLAIDGAIAIACLFGLAILLINMSHVMDVSDLWSETLSAAREAPFSATGSTMTVMLASTLVPTALHLFFALFALAAVRPPYHGRIAPWLEDSHGGGEWGNRAIVSAYLTFWAVFALTVLWGASVFVLRGLDWLWLRLGWGLESDPYPFWASIFRAAERFVIF